MRVPKKYEFKKFFNYIFDKKSFTPVEFSDSSVSAEAWNSAKNIRGCTNQPAIIIHGIMPRAGTVYVGELLKLHPDLFAYPKQIWEMPYLQQTGKLINLQKQFLLAYEQNMGKIGDLDLLPLFGSAWMTYLQQSVPQGQRMLLKVPSVQYLSHFYATFPHEQLLLLIRDGRDVVESTINTWPQISFRMACRRWQRAADMVMAFDQRYSGRKAGYLLARFEDAIGDPESFVTKACEHFELDPTLFPYTAVHQMPVRGTSAKNKNGAVSWAPITKPKNFQPVGRWHNWTRMQKIMFKRIAGRSLLALDYCNDLDW